MRLDAEQLQRKLKMVSLADVYLTVTIKEGLMQKAPVSTHYVLPLNAVAHSIRYAFTNGINHAHSYRRLSLKTYAWAHQLFANKY